MPLTLPSPQQKSEADSSPGRCWAGSGRGKDRAALAAWLKMKAGLEDGYGQHGFPFCENYCHLPERYYRKTLEAKFILVQDHTALEIGHMWMNKVGQPSLPSQLLPSTPSLSTRGSGMKKKSLG